MNIGSLINRATELVDEGLKIYEQVKGEVKDAGSAISEDDLQAAKDRLKASLDRAQLAHNNLNSAIDQRLQQLQG